MKRGHIALRTCLGCGVRERQDALIRITRDAAGVLRLDAARRQAGRGGYLHRLPECWAHFARRKGQVRSLRVSVDRPARAALVATLTAQKAVE